MLQTLHVILHGAQLQAHYLNPLGLLAAYMAAVSGMREPITTCRLTRGTPLYGITRVSCLGQGAAHLCSAPAPDAMPPSLAHRNGSAMPLTILCSPTRM